MQCLGSVQPLRHHLHHAAHIHSHSASGASYAAPLSLRAPLQRRLRNPSKSSSRACQASYQKELWVQTTDKATLTSAMECGVSSFVFPEAHKSLASEWSKLGRFKALFLNQQKGSITDEESSMEVAKVHNVTGPADLKYLEQALLAVGQQGQQGKAPESLAGAGGIAVMDASDWKVIPAENLVAMAQRSGERANVRLFASAESAQEAEVMLGALEIGVHGVLLRTNSSGDVRALAKALETMQLASTPPLPLEQATVTHVAPAGMGERVCVDLANMLVPGEGMLVGSYASGLLLVHSECEESEYIASRPFRCNAGAVHQYVSTPGGRTAYLCELKSAREVIVCSPEGRTRRGLVGRSKLETRPLIMVDVRTSDGAVQSVMLQNAETVKLVGPTATAAAMEGLQGSNGSSSSSSQGQEKGGANNGASSSNSSSQGPGQTQGSGGSSNDSSSSATPAHVHPASSESKSKPSGRSWQTLSVSAIKPGDQVYVYRPQSAARHMGHAINEFIHEK